MDEYQKFQDENLKLNEELQRKNIELRETMESFENLVSKRTETLEIRNRVLQISQGILDVLPIVVLGIDPDELIVHCNEYARNLFPYGGLGPLGNSRNEVFTPEINALIDRLADERKPQADIEIGQQRFRGEVRRLHETLSQGIVLALIPVV